MVIAPHIRFLGVVAWLKPCTVLAPLVIMCFIKEKGLLANQEEKKGCVEVLRDTFGSKYKVRERRTDFLNLEITHLVFGGGLTLCMPDNTIHVAWIPVLLQL